MLQVVRRLHYLDQPRALTRARHVLLKCRSTCSLRVEDGWHAGRVRPLQGRHQLDHDRFAPEILQDNAYNHSEVQPPAMLRRLPALIALTLLLGAMRAGGIAVQRTSFAAQVEALSEPGGYFDTDRSISNERSTCRCWRILEQATGDRRGIRWCRPR